MDPNAWTAPAAAEAKVGGANGTAAPSHLEDAHRDAQALRLRYQEVFEFAPDGYLVTDGHGVIREANQAAAALLNTPKEFLGGKPLAFFITREGRHEFYRRLTLLHRHGGGARDWEVCLRPPRGEQRDVALTVTALLDVDGAAGYRWLLRDITPGKRTEQALSAVRTFSDVLVDTVQVIILVVDAGGYVLRSNPFLTAVSGYTAAELLGRDWCELLVGQADRPQARALVQMALRGAGAGGPVSELVSREGRRRAVTWSAQPISRDTGAAAVLLTGRDVTDLHEAQRQALQAERLAAIGQTVAGLAHEGRNALQRSQACLERVGWKVQHLPDVLDLIVRARKAQDDLVRLFEDVQGYAAPVRLDPGGCDLAEIWRNSWAELADQRAGRDALLREEVQGVDLVCHADRFRLGQVFRNVLENALAACADPVRIDVTCTEAAVDGSPGVRVSVRDNGPGLSPEQRRHLFEPFFTTKVKGTGLGMAIVKRIVEAHGGRIAVAEAHDGPEHRGAEIIITLPRSRP